MRYSKIILSDFSSLHIKEIWKNGEISKYSYYWFSAGSNLILGWDNAPHHINVTSFPHHRHTVDGVEPAEERNLPDVLEYLGNIF
ncbi:MAG: hypothetical protein GY765_35130 [bacterium]|nr:hypothetical protein [bacterium]